MTEQQLLDLKNDIEEAKTTVSELKGQEKALMKQLKDDWKCVSIAEAESKLKKIEGEITSLEKKIETGVKELEDKHNIE